MKDTTELHILIQAQEWWTSVKVTGVPESKNFRVNYLAKYLIDLDGIWCPVEASSSDEPDIEFVLVQTMFKKESSSWVISHPQTLKH